MYEGLWLIPGLPLAGSLFLMLFGAGVPRRAATTIGVGSIALSLLVALALGSWFLVSPPLENAFTQALWTWIDMEGFTATIGLRLDALSLLMMLVVTFVGFLIHWYSTEFMADDPGYSRFFAFMNLFVGSMLTLVLADNLLLLYLGWEGVGLCSYLLIGFWYEEPANGAAARKAFLVTRVGDTAMAIGLLLLVSEWGTLEIQEILTRAAGTWTPGSGAAVAAAALLLGGALGKSAQLPLQTWLPDAMAGPTPTSALIHAATMVTAGVYLIARMHGLFLLAPGVQLAIAVIGAVTLLMAGFSALVQWDIKRVLAYSTISQIGYMFLALGVGAWSAAMFHFMTHAFFKALLFLAAGAVIECLRHEHDMFRMGGLRQQLPLVFWTFLIGAASLSAVPLVTAGFYSKDLILELAWSAQSGSPWLWGAGLAGAALTSLYTFRMVFLVFFGVARQEVSRRPGRAMQVPLLALAVLAIIAGVVETPRYLGGGHWFSGFLETVLPATDERPVDAGVAVALPILAAAASLAGIYLAWRWIVQRPADVENLARSPWGTALRRLWFADWGFDFLYDRLIVRPYLRLAEANREDVIDAAVDGTVSLARWFHRITSRTETGQVRWYAGGILLGAVVALAIVVWL